MFDVRRGEIYMIKLKTFGSFTGGKGRTKLHPLVYERRDVVAYVCMLAMVIASVVLIVKF